MASAGDKSNEVVILATGGTIAGSAEISDPGRLYESGQVGVEVLLSNAVPQLKDIADVSAVNK